jgi:hypothetical protein
MARQSVSLAIFFFLNYSEALARQFVRIFLKLGPTLAFGVLYLNNRVSP